MNMRLPLQRQQFLATRASRRWEVVMRGRESRRGAREHDWV